jgi:hypothetical protein
MVFRTPRSSLGKIFASDWVGGQQFSWAVSSTDLRLQSTSITCSTIWRTLEWMVFRFCLRNWRRQAPSAIFSLVAGDYIGMCCAQDLLYSCRFIDLLCSLSLTGVSIPFASKDRLIFVTLSLQICHFDSSVFFSPRQQNTFLRFGSSGCKYLRCQRLPVDSHKHYDSSGGKALVSLRACTIENQ